MVKRDVMHVCAITDSLPYLEVFDRKYVLEFLFSTVKCSWIKELWHESRFKVPDDILLRPLIYSKQKSLGS